MFERDQWLIIALKFLRLLAYGQTTVVLVPFLLSVGATDEATGLFMSLTLFGDVVISVFVTAIADKVGRRVMLATSSVAMIISGVIFATTDQFWLLLLAAILGVISPSGDEVGPFRAIEESTLAHLTPKKQLPVIFAVVNVVSSCGKALGVLSGGLLDDYLSSDASGHRKAYRIIFFMYSFTALLTFILQLCLSPKVEDIRYHISLADDEEAENPLLDENITGSSTEGDEVNGTLPENDGHAAEQVGLKGAQLTAGLILPFGLDSLADGFMPNSWLVEYMHRTFQASTGDIGKFLFVTNLISAFTAAPAVVLTHKVGPVLAIALTKLAAGLFIGIVPLASSANGAMIDIMCRSLFDAMDVVPRQVFLTHIIPAEDRTRVLGLVNVTKTLARGVGPIGTGILAGKGLLKLSFYLVGSLEWVFAFLVVILFLRFDSR